jgi:hypothetical protein
MSKHLNLLPPERRAHLRRGAFLVSAVRIVHQLIIGLGVLSASGGIFIVGMWLLAITFTGSGSTQLQDKVTQYIELREEVSEKNELLQMVNRLGNDRIVWSDHLVEFLEVIPPGTTISSLTGDARVGIFEFSGTAITRSALVIFEERLNQLSWVNSVAAPRRNFLKKDSPKYTFELRLEGYETVNNK